MQPSPFASSTAKPVAQFSSGIFYQQKVSTGDGAVGRTQSGELHPRAAGGAVKLMLILWRGWQESDEYVFHYCCMVTTGLMRSMES